MRYETSYQKSIYGKKTFLLISKVIAKPVVVLARGTFAEFVNMRCKQRRTYVVRTYVRMHVRTYAHTHVRT